MTSKASGIVPSWHCADLESVTKVGRSGWQGEAARQLEGKEAAVASVRQKDGEVVLLLILFLMLMYAFQFIISKAKCTYRNIGFQIMKKFSHFPGWQRDRNCVPRLLALWPEQAARVQRVLRLQGNHLQPAAILNETNCKYKMSRPEATLHLY